ncbi:uncharacterized protein LOC21393455 [Morus notabilis]|uniref:uncharacterized protein LOC21393455 n=1 Tax=Morus notabilis TaxID=981085 RepID=UPI000CED5402|nr:uncharacterized protein LOC21393455 [Morus notabilis]
MKEQEEIQLPKQETIWENQPSTSRINVFWVIENEQRLQHGLKTERCNSNDLEEPESSVPQEERKNVKTVRQSVKEIMLHSRQHFNLQQLSIGPIHAAKSGFFNAKLKIKLAEHFINISGRTKDILLRGIKEKAEEIKKYFHKDAIMLYAVEEHYNDDELIILVYFDGCAILGFIDAYVNQKLNMFDISPGEAASIQEDLFLLENQIPFIVLESLMGVQTESGNKDLVLDFCRFIALMGNNLGEFTKFLLLDSVHKHPLHILDLLREVQLLDNPNCFHQNECMPTYLIRRLFSLLCYCACGAVAFISWILKRFNKPESLPQYSRVPFLNVQELKNAGIEFKPSDSLKSISFHSSFFTTAQLKLPRLVLDNVTVKMLFNFAAYEMCLSESHRNQEPWLISYMKLLESLVDDENDVKDLKAADILQTGHISDADVANLINGMGSKLLPPAIDTYARVKKKIGMHCRSRSRRRCALWIAQVYNTHFRNPWTILALFAAIAVLVLTFVQTWYAVNPKN